MLSTPSQPTLSNRAAGKARATDVGIRARAPAIHAQAQVAQHRAALGTSASVGMPGHSSDSHVGEAAARQSTTVSPQQLHRRSPSAAAVLDFCPNEYHAQPQRKGEFAGPVPKPNVKGRPSDADLRNGALYVNSVRVAVLTRESTHAMDRGWRDSHR